MSPYPPGFRVGHWTDLDAVTGCTVILCPPRTVGSCDVRGSSPASRELALLAPDKTMMEVHALLLTGGSAFGLAAGDGVMHYLEEQGVGYQTPWAKVPIVPGAAVFDLNIGSPTTRPTAKAGYAAARAASEQEQGQGCIGAGVGATVGKWAGIEKRMKGGVGVGSRVAKRLRVTALAVVNSVGDVIDERSDIIAGARDADGEWSAQRDPLRTLARFNVPPNTNTTLVALMTNVQMTKVEAHRLAQRAHDGMARAIIPAHTSYDGDVAFVLASGPEPAEFDLVAELGAAATAEAIRSAVRHSTTLCGVTGLS